jgi:acyl carrier protein
VSVLDALASDLDLTIRAAVAPALAFPPESLTPDVDLLAELGDDDRAISMIVAVEDAFDVRLPDDFLDGIVTYGDFTRAVRLAVGF